MKYHVPTGFGFSPKASGFYPFDDATDLASEGGGGDVVWMIQASASNHKPKGRFFWYAFGIYKPKEPSLWFAEPSSPPSFETCRRHVPTLWCNMLGHSFEFLVRLGVFIDL